MKPHNLSQHLMKHAQEIGLLENELSHRWMRTAKTAVERARLALIKAADELHPPSKEEK